MNKKLLNKEFGRTFFSLFLAFVVTAFVVKNVFAVTTFPLTPITPPVTPTVTMIPTPTATPTPTIRPPFTPTPTATPTVNRPPLIFPLVNWLKTAYVNLPYEAFVVVTDPDRDQVGVIIRGLPLGLTYSCEQNYRGSVSCAIRGRARLVGNYIVTVIAVDNRGASATKSYALLVSKP